MSMNIMATSISHLVEEDRVHSFIFTRCLKRLYCTVYATVPAEHIRRLLRCLAEMAGEPGEEHLLHYITVLHLFGTAYWHTVG